MNSNKNKINFKSITTSLFLASMLTSFSSFAQLEVFSNGSTALGSTSQPTTNYILQATGNSLFTSASGSTSNSAAAIIGGNGYSSTSAPDYTWNGDLTTGLFHPSSGVTAFAVGGNERMRISSSANGSIQFTNWTNVYLDWNNGDCCGTPALYPATNWYLQLGTTTKFIGDAYISHELYVTAPSSYSDRTIKKNINYNLDSALIKLKKLKPVSYNLDPAFLAGAPQEKINQYCRKQYGVIAQDLVQVFPELTDTVGGKLTVQYTGLIPIIVEAIKLQQAQLDSLKQALTACCNKGSDNRTQSTGGLNPTILNNNTGNNQAIANGAMLYQNTPNPWNQTTVVKCYVPQGSQNVSLLVFDLNGTLKNTFPINETGTVNITINANQLVSGMYYYTLLINGQEVDTKKMILTQ